jgi:sortase B
MEDGSRFAALLNYKNLDYYKKHPIIEFDTIYEKNTWKIVACYITNGSTASDNGYFFDFTFNHCSDLCYEEYIEEIKKRSLYDTGVDILPTDRLLTLCTCTYEYNDARLLVIARMVRNGESTQVNTNLADYKTEPVKYPDSYYDNPNSNPYKNDKKFYLY